MSFIVINSRPGLGVLVSTQDLLQFCEFLRFSHQCILKQAIGFCYLGFSSKFHYQDGFCVKILSTLTSKKQRIPNLHVLYL